MGKNKGGHPPKYKTPAVMEKKFNDYFAYCEKEEFIPNIMGMTLFMGFADRHSWIDNAKRSSEFSHIIKRAKLRCIEHKFQMAAVGKMDKVVFIFDAVNNHGFVNTKNQPYPNINSAETYVTTYIVRQKVE